MNAGNEQVHFTAALREIQGRGPHKAKVRVRLYLLLLVLDCVALLVGYALGTTIRGGTPLTHSGLDMSLLMLPIFAGIAVNSDAYAIKILRRMDIGIHRAVMSLLFAAATVMFLAFFLGETSNISRLAFALGTVLSAGLLAMERILFDRYQRRVLGNPIDELLLIDGVLADVADGVTVCDATHFKLRPDLRDPLMLDRLAAAFARFDRIVVACPDDRRAAWAMLLKGANLQGEVLFPHLQELGPVGVGSFHGQDTLQIAIGPLSLRSRAMKRSLDLALTVPTVIVLAPVLLMTMIAIKLDSRGSAFFKQSRLGRGNRLFKIYKFRSMRTEMCDPDGDRSASRDDDRITRVGRFIRATSIDELPQLFNVLKGDMSLVGPRPHALGSLAGSRLFWDVDQRYWHRHASKPGITGLAQIRGHRGATHDAIDLTNRLQADLEYVQGWSLMRDIAILFGTIRVLVHRNAY